MDTTFTTALRNAIRADGRSLSAIADAAGADKGQLSRLMRGERSVTLDSADRLLVALGLVVRLSRQRGTTPKGR